MIDIEQVQKLFIFTITVVIGAIGLGIVSFIVYLLWQKGTPLRQRIKRHRLPSIPLKATWQRIRHSTSNLVRRTLANIWNFMLAGLSLALSFFLERWERLSEERQELCAIVIVFTILFGLAYIAVKASIGAILGIITAGLVVGIVAAPFVALYCLFFKKFRALEATAYGLITIPAGGWIAYALIAFLAIMTDD